EEELRKSGEAKYAHLSDELHVLIEVFAPPGEAYSRMSHALEEIKKFLVPTPYEERKGQYLFEDSNTNRKYRIGIGMRLGFLTLKNPGTKDRAHQIFQNKNKFPVIPVSMNMVMHSSDNAEQFTEIPSTEFLVRVVCQLSQNTKFQKDYNDEIRQEQLRELSYLNGSEDSSRGRGIRGRGIRVPPAAPSRGRGGAIPPPLPGRGAQAPRGAPVTRGALPVPPVARGVPTPRARGAPSVPGYRAPPPPAHEAYEDYVNDSLGDA
ncbi:KH domain-containing, partial [Lamprotornis superbus]